MFHQLLQWHNLLSSVIVPIDVPTMKINMFWDGVFHAFTWLMTAIGLALLWRAGRRPNVVGSTPTFVGSLLLGWGLFDVVEGGTCGFKDWDPAARSAELTYELAREHRGRGTMTMIAQAVVMHGFADMQLQVIRALVMVDNTASNRLLEKLGFQRAATLPSLRACGGVLRDFYRYERE